MSTNTRRGLVLLLFLLGAWGASEPCQGGSPVASEVRVLLEEGDHGQGLRVACERIHASDDLLRHYRAREFAPLWVTAAGPLPLFHGTVELLRTADRHGLTPADYHLGCLAAAEARFRDALDKGLVPEPRDLAAQDVVLTDAFLTFGSHLVAGRVDPEQLYPQWLSTTRKADLLGALRELEEHGDPQLAVRRLAPGRGEYARSVAAAEALAKDTWQPYSYGRDLQRGMHDQHLPELRRRLAAGGDLDPAADLAEGSFDVTVEEAVRRFQARHGLAADGIVGPAMRRALNVPAAERCRQLLLNLERWRWLPRSWGQRYLLVNAADYALEAFAAGERVLRMRVIVGEQYRRTPVFSERMTYLEINPYWNVPASIAAEELLPKLQRDPEYLSTHHYELLSGWEASSRQLDPREVDWRQVRADALPGRIRQLPGPWNALGRIKFMFPNRFNVYLHDTPDRHLFRRSQRALSHGCIRVERPLDLAGFALEETPGWDRERVEAAIAGGERQVVPLTRPVPVHLLYLTAWVDEAGAVQFREDIYQRDDVLWRALQGAPEEPPEVPGDREEQRAAPD
ncbi:MAG: L,D-transpeptidase family protein [Deferrisomatales bacterium]|nr:L,D-transpeptidase family protein [Deferrisomatales bacterium]